MPAGQPHAHEAGGGGGGGGAANHSNHHPAADSPPPPPPPALPAEVVPAYPPPESEDDETWVWTQIKAEARRDADAEPALASFLYATVLTHPSLPRSLSFHLANKLCSSTLLSTLLYDLFLATLAAHPSLRAAVVADLLAARCRDPACVGLLAQRRRREGHPPQPRHRPRLGARRGSGRGGCGA